MSVLRGRQIYDYFVYSSYVFYLELELMNGVLIVEKVYFGFLLLLFSFQIKI